MPTTLSTAQRHLVPTQTQSVVIDTVLVSIPRGLHQCTGNLAGHCAGAAPACRGGAHAPKVGAQSAE